MQKSYPQAISDRRRILENPYAYLTEIEETYEINAAKKSSECPYAYVDEIEHLNRPVSRFDAIDQSTVRRKQQSAHLRRSDFEIETLTRQVLAEIWKNRESLFPNVKALMPIDVVDPITALEMYGYEVKTVGALGQLSIEDKRLANVAGILDTSRRQVLLSSGFPNSVRNFTAAHELGHVMMHDFVGVHRDKPIEGGSQSSNPQEREAEKFAAFFLMPEKLLKSVFELLFGSAPFVLNEETRFALAGSVPNQRGDWSPRNVRELSLVLSTAERFNGRSNTSLMNQFRVSRTAMAIRLEQLGLISL